MIDREIGKYGDRRPYGEMRGHGDMETFNLKARS